MSRDQEVAHINPKTTIPLMWVVGIVMGLISIFGVILGAYAYLEDRFNSQRQHSDDRFTAIEKRLISIEATGADRWSKRDMRTWAAEFKAANPGLEVPSAE